MYNLNSNTSSTRAKPATSMCGKCVHNIWITVKNNAQGQTQRQQRNGLNSYVQLIENETNTVHNHSQNQHEVVIISKFIITYSRTS